MRDAMDHESVHRTPPLVIIREKDSSRWVQPAAYTTLEDELRRCLSKLPRPDGDVVLVFSISAELLARYGQDESELREALESESSRYNVDWTLFDYLGVGGGENGHYHCSACLSDGSQFVLTNPQGSATTCVTLCVGQPGTYPTSHLVSFDMAYQAACYFAARGDLDPSLVWEA